MPDQVAGVDWQIRLPADADGQIAQRPVVRESDAMQRHGLGVTLRGRCGNDTDADIALHQSTDGIEAAQIYPNNLRNKPMFVVNGGRDPL